MKAYRMILGEIVYTSDFGDLRLSISPLAADDVTG